eukprot:scaffold23504_cov101-Isochrysis_galbana.AAC.2
MCTAPQSPCPRCRAARLAQQPSCRSPALPTTHPVATHMHPRPPLIAERWRRWWPCGRSASTSPKSPSPPAAPPALAQARTRVGAPIYGQARLGLATARMKSIGAFGTCPPSVRHLSPPRARPRDPICRREMRPRPATPETGHPKIEPAKTKPPHIEPARVGVMRRRQRGGGRRRLHRRTGAGPAPLSHRGWRPAAAAAVGVARAAARVVGRTAPRAGPAKAAAAGVVAPWTGLFPTGPDRARPFTARPSTARPFTAALFTARLFTARLFTARLLTARPLTARLFTARLLTARLFTARLFTARLFTARLFTA